MATPSRTKRVVYAALAGLGITAGAAGVAAAATTQGTPRPSAAVQQAAGQSDAPDSGDSPSYQSSVTVPQSPDTAGSAANEATNTATLAPLAKVTPDQASAAATAKVPGTAGKVQLEDENGNVVYGVEVTTANGSRTDVKVDAGNGAVLHQDSDDESGAEKGGSATETKGGPETETNDGTTRN